MHRSTGILASLAMFVFAGPALASGIVVPMDEARIVTFPRPVATLFVANPYVADVNVIDSTHAFVLGKTFGSTNLIALDSDKKVVSNSHLTVDRDNSLVVLNRGANQFTFACVRSRCEKFAAPGDEKNAYDENIAQSNLREDVSTKQASPAH